MSNSELDITQMFFWNSFRSDFWNSFRSVFLDCFRNNLLASFKKEHHETIISWFNSKHKSLLYTGLLGGNYAFGVLRPLAGERLEGKFIKKSCESIPIVQKTDEIKDEIINSWKKQIISYNEEINKLNQQAGHSFHWIASPMLSSKAATAWAGAEYVNHLSQSIYNKRYNELIEEILGENLNFISFPDKYNLKGNGFLDDRFQMPNFATGYLFRCQ